MTETQVKWFGVSKQWGELAKQIISEFPEYTFSGGELAKQIISEFPEYTFSGGELAKQIISEFPEYTFSGMDDIDPHNALPWLENLLNSTINQAVDEQLKDIIKLNNKVYDPIELEILLEKKLNLGGKP